MAKYADYVKDEDQRLLDAELTEAQEAADERRQEAAENEIPERFRGKSPVEIAKAYTELEKLNSRQAQDLGAMRKSVDELLTLQLQKSGTGAEAESKKPISSDDLYENPDATIRKVVKEESQERIKKLEEELQKTKLEKAYAKLTENFPEWQDDVKDPAMISWIHEKPFRVRLARSADAGDFDAAEELFGLYYDTQKKAQKQEQKQEKRKRVQAAGLESSGAGVPETTEKFSRSALLEKRIAAKRGDSAAQRYLDANADAIAQAYSEGRVVD